MVTTLRMLRQLKGRYLGGGNIFPPYRMYVTVQALEVRRRGHDPALRVLSYQSGIGTARGVEGAAPYGFPIR